MDHITCEGCICYQRGFAFTALCAELRRDGLCQKQVALRLAGRSTPAEIEGEYAEPPHRLESEE